MVNNVKCLFALFCLLLDASRRFLLSLWFRLGHSLLQQLKRGNRELCVSSILAKVAEFFDQLSAHLVDKWASYIIFIAKNLGQ